MQVRLLLPKQNLYDGSPPQSLVFLLENLCAGKGELVCIDHFDLMSTTQGKERFSKLNKNLSATGKTNWRIVPEFSVPGLMTLLNEEMVSKNPGFDWIYIDGSHEADDTMLDGELAWRLARKGAVVIFDDYLWDTEPTESPHHPKRGIDAFMLLHREEFEEVSSPGQYQKILVKTSEMRIGFLNRGVGEAPVDLGYTINLALTVDSAYAHAAAVAVRSAVTHTHGRVSVYVIDCGLTSEDKRKMERSCCIRSSITMNFLSLPADSLTVELGTAVWAKVDMVGILPVERVLYLDADILVRADLGELWKTSLRAEDMLAAAIDIGHPEGHDELTRGGYFNAGVLLLDLAKIRLQITQLLSLARSMKEARYRDQDALNVYFKDQWTRLDVKWNAQGLGTYANDATFEARSQILGLSSAQRNPSIVHFTGPVHPSLETVLNPFVQPYTAKPWGYAGAPGNPYCAEWWACLEQTEWKGMSKSDEYRVGCSQAKRLALEAAAKAFDERLSEFDIPSSC